MWRVRFFKTELAGGLDSRLSWVASSSCEVAEQSVCIFLSCSTLASMTLQILACLVCVQLLATRKSRATCEIQSRVPVSLHNLEHFFTLSHTLSLHDSHLNIGLLIAKIQANLTWNKANKMVDTIQPYNLPFWLFRDKTLKQTLDLTCELGTVEQNSLTPNSRICVALKP